MSYFSDNPNPQDSYLTLAWKSEGSFKEIGSKFLYFAFPVRSEEAIKSELDALRKTYFDASHHCFAWVLGKDAAHFRANDDGEPNHSAGDPILGQIRSNQLTHVLIVVVRYFGGTKLGISGLIKAYKMAASLAIAENQIIREYLKVTLDLTFPYSAMNKVMKVIKAQELEISSQKMELDCQLILSIREGLMAQVLPKLKEIDGLTINFD